MLTDAEYATNLGLEVSDLGSLNPDMVPFTEMEFDLGAAVNPDGSPMFPELEGHYTPLFEVKRKPAEKTEDFDYRIADKAAKLALYISQGYAFESPAKWPQ